MSALGTSGVPGLRERRRRPVADDALRRDLIGRRRCGSSRARSAGAAEQRGKDRSPGMNGKSTAPRVSSIIRPQTRASALSEVENGGTWYQNVYSHSQGWPG